MEWNKAPKINLIRIIRDNDHNNLSVSKTFFPLIYISRYLHYLLTQNFLEMILLYEADLFLFLCWKIF